MNALRTWTAPRADASLPVAIEVLRRGPISRADIARRLQLSAGSLTRLSTPLIEEGLLREVGEHNDGRVGRPTRLLDVDADSRHFIGMKIRENEIIAARTNLRGEISTHLSEEITNQEPAEVIIQIARLTRELSHDQAISGIGIGIGGLIRDRTHVIDARFLGWKDLDLAGKVTAATGIPTLIDNDLVAFTEYEHWFGEGREDDRFAVVTLGVGTGFGLVANGAIVAGEDYGIGLVGHWPLDPTGPLCFAGHRGCATSILNSDSIARHVSDALGNEVGYEQALDLALQNDPAARRVIDDAGRGLGRLIAAICNLTMPQRIIIAGEGVRLAAVARPALEAGIALDRDPRATTPPIVLASKDNVQWCRGAAVLAIQAFVHGTLPATSNAPAREPVLGSF
ncbi:ROK family transcriptional regulator [Paenarthrobacter sp. CM16]|uniref:ROK family transcriptional regulator n=1 Tax=Paenarthrobacter sp. CM16 TaxID=2738447 RepID=UPI001557857D|nr:ROK family transcriptional regulator [Paenarthrobacter sp. CM16]NQD89304.1 ROK family transcriptional regulator [Paenarthrobacter sp. CM16]